MHNHSIALLIALMLPLQNQTMEKSTAPNKILHNTKKISIQGFSLIKKTWDIVKPTAAQQQIMFSMLFMAGIFAVSQAAVDQLPDCNYLKGLYGPIDKKYYSSEYDDMIEHSARKNGCVDMCQMSFEIKSPEYCDKTCMENNNIPDTFYMAKCYGAPHNIPDELIVSHQLHKNNDGSSLLKYISTKGQFPATE